MEVKRVIFLSNFPAYGKIKAQIPVHRANSGYSHTQYTLDVHTNKNKSNRSQAAFTIQFQH